MKYLENETVTIQLQRFEELAYCKRQLLNIIDILAQDDARLIYPKTLKEKVIDIYEVLHVNKSDITDSQV